MQMIDTGDTHIAVHVDGPEDGHPLVMAHALGLASAVFDPVLPHLPAGLRVIRYDARGHGASDVPEGPYHMGRLVGDAEAVCDALEVRGATFLGLSMGGLTAIGLAVKRPDIVGALILSNTAAKIGTPETWAERIAAVEEGGMAAVVAPTLDRWFAKDFTDRGVWGERLSAADPAGFTATCAALSGTDMREVASGLSLPCLCIAGSDDGSVPPDLVRETAETIPGAEFALLRRAGHLPCLDQPEAYGAAIAGFLHELGRV